MSETPRMKELRDERNMVRYQIIWHKRKNSPPMRRRLMELEAKLHDLNLALWLESKNR